MSDILRFSVCVRQNYLNQFSPVGVRNPATAFRLRYSEGHVQEYKIREVGWISDSRRTGELLPGRPAVRPGLTSGKLVELKI